MYIKPILHPEDFIDTTWGKNRSRKSKMMFDAVKNTNKNFKDKTLICLGGGCGRNADKLRQLGFSKVTNADINEKHLSIGKKYYKEVEHIKLDRDNPIKGYDFFFYEDIFDEAFNWHTLLNIAKWNNVSEHVLSEYSYTIYRFNSKRMDQTYKQSEKIGDAYIDKKFGEGNLQIMADFKQVEDLAFKNFTLSLTDFNISIEAVKSHSYQAIGQIEHWVDDAPVGFKATLINYGLHKYLDKKNLVFVNKN
tara:strand:+ start:351 stop:1097 length:747 start_codon:yes stop_codon:yes gene_type:complete